MGCVLVATASTGRIVCNHESRYALTTDSIRQKAAATSRWVRLTILNGRPLLGIHLLRTMVLPTGRPAGDIPSTFHRTFLGFLLLGQCWSPPI